jgi:DeoR family transcriptional regulator, glycerol-3-phosphate regulon repressor
MTLNPRQTQLLEAIRSGGSASVETLADAVGVTVQTVRRDINLLAKEGLVARFHGGARMPGSTVENIAYRQRQDLNAQGKRAIARSVAAAVPNGCSLLLNIGTTTEAIARELIAHKGLRIITNNLQVAAILADNRDCEVIIVGGTVRPVDHGIIGGAAVEFIRQFKVDIGIIGISGIELDGTLRDFDLLEVQVARAIIEHSRQVWLAADHSKFNRAAMIEVAPISAVDVLYTDTEPPEPLSWLMTEHGVNCEIAREISGS